ncbi:hypothetical protein [Methylobacterium segetis]|uniref:hypothetical protein n=1 Tax=Methylobacterium segetis TaxID=2488750 RepID=UPI0010482B69|nr:hypothetical protein [Methylobacterium segetis]
MFYSLYFLTCLTANPAHCVTRIHTFSEDVWTPQQCLTVAQPRMAQWQRTHDRWRVEKFRCGRRPSDEGARI